MQPLIGKVFMFAFEPSERITRTFLGITFEGFGMNLPHGINGIKANATPAAPSNLRKSRRVSPLS